MTARLNFSKVFSLMGQLHAGVPFALGSSKALPPLFVQIEVTHRCNAGCPMCYQNNTLGRESELTVAEIKGIIDQLPSWCVLSLTGGEPFVRKDFAEILAYGLGKKKCTLLTNGSLVNDDHIEMLVRNKLLLLAVSLDGIGETHDGIRRLPGLFASAVEMIKKIQQKKRELNSRFPLIDIKTVMLKENLGQLSDILALAEDLGADFITYSVPRSLDNLYTPPYRENLAEICQSRPPCPQFDEHDLQLLTSQATLIKGHRGKTRVREYPANILREEFLQKLCRQELSARDFKACALPWSRLSISPQGDVYPCLSYRVGNVRQETLAQIWNGSRFRAFRQCLERNRLSDFCLSCCNSVANESSLNVPNINAKSKETA